MCDLADGLKLCACDEDLADPDWVLERRDESLMANARRGRALIPRYSVSEKACLERVLERLEAGCFDFPYRKTEGDVLHLRGDARVYRFRVEHGRWVLDRSNSLAGWRTQMVEALRGRRGG